MAVKIPQDPTFDPYNPENLKSLDQWAKLANSMEGSKRQFWNDDEIFEQILKKHGGIKASREQKEAIAGLMSVIYYGEIVAMHTSSQLVGMVPDLAAQFVAAFQTMEEAKHVTSLGKYLKALDIPLPEINPNIRKLLDDVRNTADPAEKLVGMNLLVELSAHSIFQGLMASFDEPVLKELLHYIDLDEVKHVALARNYAAEMLQRAGPLRRARIMLKQFYWMSLAFRAQQDLFRQYKALRLDMNSHMKRNFEDMRKVYKDVPGSVQRIWMIKPPSKAWGDRIADWMFPPEGKPGQAATGAPAAS
ncbi:MAG: ferritin-like domain-containing protein [Bdellovibrionota bacterium]